MKTTNYPLMRILFALVVGLILVIWPGQAASFIVITVGVLFLISGVVPIIGYLTRRSKKNSNTRLPFEAIGSLLLGLWLIIDPTFFANLIMFLLGFILILGGIWQIANLSSAKRVTHVPGAFYIVPVLVLLIGLYVIFAPSTSRDTIFIIIGVTSLVYALSDLLNLIKFNSAKPASTIDKNNIEDAKIIDEQ